MGSGAVNEDSVRRRYSGIVGGAMFLLPIIIALASYFVWADLSRRENSPKLIRVHPTVHRAPYHPSGARPSGPGPVPPPSAPSQPASALAGVITPTAPPAPAPSPAGANTVTMLGNVFIPVDLTVAPGTAIRWINTSAIPHTVTPDVSGGPNSDRYYPYGIQPGANYSWIVPKNALPGTIWYYHCRYHGQSGQGMGLGSGMAGSITVK